MRSTWGLLLRPPQDSSLRVLQHPVYDDDDVIATQPTLWAWWSLKKVFSFLRLYDLTYSLPRQVRDTFSRGEGWESRVAIGPLDCANRGGWAKQEQWLLCECRKDRKFAHSYPTSQESTGTERPLFIRNATALVVRTQAVVQFLNSLVLSMFKDIQLSVTDSNSQTGEGTTPEGQQV